MLTDRCLEHYFLGTCTWSSQLVPAHSLCSILVIVQFRRVAPDCPIKNAILDCSRSPPRRNSKRDSDYNDHPPPKRLKSNSSSTSKSCFGASTSSRVRQSNEHDTFDSTLPLEPNTAVETELDILYGLAEARDNYIRCIEQDVEKALNEDCATAFALLDEIEAEKPNDDDDADTEITGVPSLVWDPNQDLLQLQQSTQPPATTSSTPSKKTVQFDLSSSSLKICDQSHENSNGRQQNDSPPSSVPTPIDSDDHAHSASFMPSEDEEEYEGQSQVTVSMDIPTVANRPLTSTRDEREISLNERSDNALNSADLMTGEKFNPSGLR